jgi:hypothetical protein
MRLLRWTEVFHRYYARQHGSRRRHRDMPRSSIHLGSCHPRLQTRLRLEHSKLGSALLPSVPIRGNRSEGRNALGHVGGSGFLVVYWKGRRRLVLRGRLSHLLGQQIASKGRVHVVHLPLRETGKPYAVNTARQCLCNPYTVHPNCGRAPWVGIHRVADTAGCLGRARIHTRSSCRRGRGKSHTGRGQRGRVREAMR